MCMEAHKNGLMLQMGSLISKKGLIMKNVILLVALGLFSLVISAQEINWLTLDEALKSQKKQPKKIMMDVYTSWCGPCKMLDKNTFHNQDVVNYVNKHYYAVKFDAEGNDVVTYDNKTFDNPGYNPANANRRNAAHKLTMYLQVSAYPTIVFFDETGKMLAPIKGYKDPQGLELYLKLFKNDHHKDMDTQAKFTDYATNFKPEFKG